MTSIGSLLERVFKFKIAVVCWSLRVSISITPLLNFLIDLSGPLEICVRVFSIRKGETWFKDLSLIPCLINKMVLLYKGASGGSSVGDELGSLRLRFTSSPISKMGALNNERSRRSSGHSISMGTS